MENQTTLQKLNDKVLTILNQHQAQKSEIDMLRTELVTLKSECEIKNQEIDKLVEENLQKDIEIEEIVDKIESIMG